MAQVWKSANGSVTPITEMNTFHIKNAINKVKTQLTTATGAALTEAQTILTALETEFSGRPDREEALNG